MVTDTGSWLGLTLCDGRYRVVRKLGEGGMAFVYVARDDKLERDVVIKAPRANLIHDAAFSGRFTREVRSLAKLAHPHIVPLIDIGEHQGFPFAVMHYLTGGSLRDRQPKAAEGKNLPMAVNTLSSWLPAVAHALDFVHKNHYIHRDVKPENILFDEEGQVFLSDLGVIKALTDTQEPQKPMTVMTGAGMVLGTPHYMSPELIMGEAMDGRVDQYALAVTLYEVLTGNFPFNGSSAPAIFIQQTTKPPPPIRSAAPQVPQKLAAAIEKALAKTPAERFASCGEFAKAVLNAGGAMVVATLLEETPAQKPIPVTLVERPPARIDTPSDLKSMTRASTRPSPAAPAATPASPAVKSGSRSGLYALVGGIVVLMTAAAVWMLLPQKATGSLQLAKVDPITLAPGGKRAVDVTIERKNLAGEIECWLDGLPDDVAATRITLSGSQSKGKIDVLLPAKASPRTINAMLKVKSGTIEADTPVVLAIPGLRIVPLAMQKLKAGETTTVNVEIERVACEGPVLFAVENLPAKVTRPRLSENDKLAADATTFPLELKVADDAGDYQGSARLTAKIDEKTTGFAELPIAVAGAAVVKTVKVDPTPVKPKDPIEKKTEKDPVDKKIDTVKLPVKIPPGELVLNPMPDLQLRPGERRRVLVRVERRNVAGPVFVRFFGMPQGVSISPASTGKIEADQNEATFDLNVDTTAPATSRSFINVMLVLNSVTKTGGFSLTIDAPPPLQPPQLAPALLTKAEELTVNDPPDRVRNNSRHKSYTFFLKKDQPYVIEMTGNFDCYLRLENNNGEVASDDNSGGGRNARIQYTPTTGGAHYIIATSADGSLGRFTVTLRQK